MHGNQCQSIYREPQKTCSQLRYLQAIKLAPIPFHRDTADTWELHHDRHSITQIR